MKLFTIFFSAFLAKNCRENVRLGYDGEFPLIPLASTQGSGNTWTRQLLEAATGIYTGSIYNETRVITEDGFVGEAAKMLSGRTIGNKNHGKSFLSFAYGAILIIRNPYDVFKAEFNRKNSREYDRNGGHTGLAKEHLFLSEKWDIFVQVMIRRCDFPYRWLGINEAYIREGQIESEIPIQIVYFEDLKANAAKEMEKVLYFLEQNIGFRPDDAEKRLACIRNSEAEFEKFKRPKQELDFEIWNATKIEAVDAAIYQLSQAIEEAGLPPMPNYYKSEKFLNFNAEDFEGVEIRQDRDRVRRLYNKYRSL